MGIQRIRGTLLLLAATVCSCKGAPDRTATPKPELTAMAMLPGFRAHLDSVATHPSMLKGSMPSHEAEVKAVVGAMHADMTAMGMHSDAAYEALADSVVAGSAALGTASGPDFDRLVAGHIDQLRRLAAVYEKKTAAM